MTELFKTTNIYITRLTSNKMKFVKLRRSVISKKESAENFKQTLQLSKHKGTN